MKDNDCERLCVPNEFSSREHLLSWSLSKATKLRETEFEWSDVSQSGVVACGEHSVYGMLLKADCVENILEFDLLCRYTESSLQDSIKEKSFVRELFLP